MKKGLLFGFVILIAAGVCSAVTSKIVKHKALEDFTSGKTDNTVISSHGEIFLSLATQTLAEDFNDAWTINSIVCKDGDKIYIGTSPNGRIFEYKGGKITCIYPVEKPKIKETKQAKKEVNEPNSPKKMPAKTHLTNEHIFKLALDSKGNLLAGVSGEKERLMRYDGKKFETIFEPNQSPYIFAITLDKDGNIFIGTGPKGQIWRLDSKGRNPQLVYTSSQDKNILCLVVGKDGFLYAGTDTRGLVYKINPETKTATVLYDSDENEINDLLFDSKGNLYAAATSYKSIKAQLRGIPEMKKPFALGKPEDAEPAEEPSEGDADEQSESLKIANTPADDDSESKPMPIELKRGKQSSSSHIYKIDPNGFVTDVFSRNAVFFKMYLRKNSILLGTGNKAELFGINPETEIETLDYADKQASQITDIAKFGDDDVVFATANPPKIIRISSDFAETGNFQSDIIDAGRPALWGKLQVEADIPSDTQILLSARSGNVGDINDAAFSAWTEPVKLTGAVDLKVPLARFCQYKLILNGTNNSTPVIREVATAFVIPNLAPKVTEITVSSRKKAEHGVRNIEFSAEDENDDQLIFRIDFRQKNRKLWIKLVEDIDKPEFEWNTKTIEDGTYEIRVTAFDCLSNNAVSALTGSRISDPIIIDNTAPVIEKQQLTIEDKSAILTFNVVDELSTIGCLAYTIDSNEKWINVLPDDEVFDTTAESFTIKAENLDPGQHIIAVRVSDAEDNVRYKTFEAEIK